MDEIHVPSFSAAHLCAHPLKRNRVRKTVIGYNSRERNMPTPVSPDTTQLLQAWAGGDEQALEELVPRVYCELRRLAGKLLKNERKGETLQATDLVHEVYVRLIEVTRLDWQHRAHFFAVSAGLMRRILVDRARRRSAAKRGGKKVVVDLDERLDLSSTRSRELIALDDALSTLSAIDARRARIVELRFFGGLDVKETAEVVGLSPETVMRDWKLARAWLLAELSQTAKS
jgi:RNA polymerase sigma-70 factor, ECF subfamily